MALTDKRVAALKPRPKLYVFPDPQLPGHYVRVMPSGSKSYVAIARDPRGTQVWKTIGKTADLTIEKAREEAISSARGRGGCKSQQLLPRDRVGVFFP